MRFEAHTTIPRSTLTYEGTAAEILRRTCIHATIEQLEALPVEGFTWAEFMGDMGRCWRVERIA